MITVKEVTVNYGRTVNMGNFESLRLDVSATATVDVTEDPEQVVDMLHGNLKAHVQRLVAKEVEARR